MNFKKGLRNVALFGALTMGPGFFYTSYDNFGNVDNDVIRCRQPSYSDLEEYSELGVRSILNLRGENPGKDVREKVL